MIKWIIFIISTTFTCSQLYAAEVSRSVKSGDPSLIRRYFAWNPDCTYKTIRIVVTKRPSHGNIEPRFGDYVLTAADIRGGDIGACAGTSLRVVEILYKSKISFVGRDSLSLAIYTDGLPEINDDYVIDVH
jgi:hypothetical protein